MELCSKSSDSGNSGNRRRFPPILPRVTVRPPCSSPVAPVARWPIIVVHLIEDAADLAITNLAQTSLTKNTIRVRDVFLCFFFVSITDQRGTRQQRPASYASLPLCSASASSACGTLGLKVTASSRAGLDLSADSLIIVANRVSAQFQLVLEVSPFIVAAACSPLARQCSGETARSKFAIFQESGAWLSRDRDTLISVEPRGNVSAEIFDSYLHRARCMQKATNRILLYEACEASQATRVSPLRDSFLMICVA